MNLQTAADRLGVHYQTAYRWVRDGTLRAVKFGTSYEIDEADVSRLIIQRAQPTAPPDVVRVRDWSASSDRLRSCLLRGDELAARQIVEQYDERGVGAIELVQRLIGPAMRSIGEAWQIGSVTIAQEHRATAICERMLARISHHPRGRPRGTAVVTTAPGDDHEIVSSMAALALRADHWRVHHLGTAVPEPDLLALCRDVDADIVVVSAAMTASPAVLSMQRVLAATGCPLIVGGPGQTLDDLVTQARAIASASASGEGALRFTGAGREDGLRGG